MKKKWLIIIAGIIVLALFGIWIRHIVVLNQDYQNSSSENEAWMGDTIIANDGIAYTVTEAAIYDYAAFISAYPDYNWKNAESTGDLSLLEENEDEEIKVLLYTVHMDLPEDGEGAIPSPDTVETVSGLWQSVSSMYLYDYLNPDVEYIQGGSVELQIPVPMYKSAFPDDEWAKLESGEPELQLVLCYQPEKVVYYINHADYIHASEEEIQTMQTMAADAVKLVQNISEIVTYEENVVEGSGVAKGFEYEPMSIEYYGEWSPDWDSLEASEAERFHETYSDDWLEMSNHLVYGMTFTVSNHTDAEVTNYVNTAHLVAVEPQDIHFKFSYVELGIMYYDGEAGEGKSAGLLTLEPGEQVTVRAICVAGLSDYQMQTLGDLSELDYYLAFNQGQDFNTLNDKGVLYIKFPDELVIKE